MQPRTGWIVVAAGVLAVTVALRVSDGARDNRGSTPSNSDTASAADPAFGAGVTPLPRPGASTRFTAFAPASEVREVRERIRAAHAARARQSADARRRSATRLDADIDRLEREGLIIGPQVTMMRIAAARATHDSEEAFQRTSKALLADAEARSAERRAAAQSALIRSNAEYRRRELEIVTEIAGSPEFANPTERQRALRARLTRLRSELYRRDPR